MIWIMIVSIEVESAMSNGPWTETGLSEYEATQMPIDTATPSHFHHIKVGESNSNQPTLKTSLMVVTQ